MKKYPNDIFAKPMTPSITESWIDSINNSLTFQKPRNSPTHMPMPLNPSTWQEEAAIKPLMNSVGWSLPLYQVRLLWEREEKLFSPKDSPGILFAMEIRLKSRFFWDLATSPT